MLNVIQNLVYEADFIDNSKEKIYFERLKTEIIWEQDSIRMFGKFVLEPRLTALYGDYPYKYSGKMKQAKPWTDLLYELKFKIEEKLNVKFNSVLLNYYRSGTDSMGWHSDNEAELGKDISIASLSLGSTRKFQFRKKDDHQSKQTILLASGSLLFMKGDFQDLWQHQIPKEPKNNQERINLTFRKIII